MPSAARVLTFIVSICHTAQAGRLSIMGTHLLRHFAHNHGQNKATFKHGQLISRSTAKFDKPIQLPLPQSMRFRAAAPSLSTENSNPSAQSPNPYTYGSTTGNGAKDFMTPYYGTYSRHYGPVYQLLTPMSGYGGYPATVDPRGFNAQTQNFTHGVFANDFFKPPQANAPANVLGTPANLLGQNGLLSTNLGSRFPPIFPSGPPGLSLPQQMLHLSPSDIHTVARQYPGTIPIMYPNGASNGLSNSIALHPAFAPGASWSAVPALQAAAGAVPFHPLNAGALGVVPGVVPGFFPRPQLSLPGFRSPYNPSFSMGMMQHHQLTLNGAANGFGTPGFFHPLSDHYPTPDSDPYNSVIGNPVLPPNYGKENAAGSGSGAAAK